LTFDLKIHFSLFYFNYFIAVMVVTMYLCY